MVWDWSWDKSRDKAGNQCFARAEAIRWACERCYNYLIGSPKFTVLTDHQPLIPLFNNPNSKPTLRVEMWLMYLQRFDFELKYIQGKNNAADYLSRHAAPCSPKDKNMSNYREEVVKFKRSSIMYITLQKRWLLQRSRLPRLKMKTSDIWSRTSKNAENHQRKANSYIPGFSMS